MKFPGGPGLRTWYFHCWGLGSTLPSWGTKNLQAKWHSQKKKKTISPVQVLAQAIPWRFHFSSTFCRWQITLEQPDSRGGQLEAVRVPCTMPVYWVVSDSLWPCGLQTTWLLCPSDFPGKNTGVGGHASSRGSSRPRDWTHISYVSPIDRWDL